MPLKNIIVKYYYCILSEATTNVLMLQWFDFSYCTYIINFFYYKFSIRYIFYIPIEYSWF